MEAVESRLSPPGALHSRTSLAASLALLAEEVAERRDLHLDLSLSGRQRDLTSEAANAIEEAVRVVLGSVDSSEQVGHLALAAEYRPEGLFVRVEHDRLFTLETRQAVEGAVVQLYESLAELGGSVSFSLGRGFGMRIELTAPYADGTPSMGNVGGEGTPSQRQATTAARAFPAAGTDALAERLTPQEEACLALLAVGHSNKEIAAHLHISVGTVKFHLAQIYSKLGVQGRGRGAAVARARELGLIFD